MNNKSKILHFTDGFDMNGINEILENRKDILYYTRMVNKEMHLVKHNKDAFFDPYKLVESLFHFYKNNNDMINLLKGVKMKGNCHFSIIININESLSEKIRNDLNKILLK